MSRANRIVSTLVLFCFVFNSAVSDLAFAQGLGERPSADKLAAASRFSVKEPELNHIAKIKAAIEANLMRFAHDSAAFDITEFIAELNKYCRDNGKTSIFSTPDVQVYYQEPDTSLPNGYLSLKCRVRDTQLAKRPRGGLVYYAVFSCARDADQGFPIYIYPEEKYKEFKASGALADLPRLNEEHEAAVNRNVEHEVSRDPEIKALDEYIAGKMRAGEYAVADNYYAAEKRPYKGIYENARYVFANPEQDVLRVTAMKRLKEIGVKGRADDRKTVLGRLNEIMGKPLVIILRKPGEKLPQLTMPAEDGKSSRKIEVRGHSSDWATYIIMEEDAVRRALRVKGARADASYVSLAMSDSTYRRKLEKWYFYEATAHLRQNGWIAADGEPANMLTDAWAGLATGQKIGVETRQAIEGLKPVKLLSQKLLTRDHATGEPTDAAGFVNTFNTKFADGNMQALSEDDIVNIIFSTSLEFAALQNSECRQAAKSAGGLTLAEPQTAEIEAVRAAGWKVVTFLKATNDQELLYRVYARLTKIRREDNRKVPCRVHVVEDTKAKQWQAYLDAYLMAMKSQYEAIAISLAPSGLGLGRLEGEAIIVGNDIEIRLDEKNSTKARLWVTAPASTTVYRYDDYCDIDRRLAKAGRADDGKSHRFMVECVYGEYFVLGIGDDIAIVHVKKASGKGKIELSVGAPSYITVDREEVAKARPKRFEVKAYGTVSVEDNTFVDIGAVYSTQVNDVRIESNADGNRFMITTAAAGAGKRFVTPDGKSEIRIASLNSGQGDNGTVTIEKRQILPAEITGTIELFERERYQITPDIYVVTGHIGDGFVNTVEIHKVEGGNDRTIATSMQLRTGHVLAAADDNIMLDVMGFKQEGEDHKVVFRVRSPKAPKTETAPNAAKPGEQDMSAAIGNTIATAANVMSAGLAGTDVLARGAANAEPKPSGDKKTVMIMGGAGYIGSTVVNSFDTLVQSYLDSGYKVKVFDNFSSGHRAALPQGVEIVQGELADKDAIKKALIESKADTVIHFAAFIEVCESNKKPAKYFENNIINTLILLEAMREAGVRKIVFSSSAAVYGTPNRVPIRESDALSPINPYGESKYMMEQLLKEYAERYGFKAVALRYFNAAGAFSCDCGEDHDPESHIIPRFIKRAVDNKNLPVNGDGSHLRSYVNVKDLADAHIRAVKWLNAQDAADPDNGIYEFFNLGGRKAYSNREIAEKIISHVSAGTGHACTSRVVFGPERKGDPKVLDADITKARTELGWEPRFSDIDTIIADAFAWHTKHKDGFSEKPAGVKEREPLEIVREMLQYLVSNDTVSAVFKMEFLVRLYKDELAKFRVLDPAKEGWSDADVFIWATEHVPGQKELYRAIENAVTAVGMSHTKMTKEHGYDVITLTGEDGNSFQVVPAMSATVKSLKVRGKEMLYYPQDKIVATGGIPGPFFFFANRIKDGKFEWKGKHYDLNDPSYGKEIRKDAKGNALHGILNERPWKVQSSGRTTDGLTGKSSVYVTLTYDAGQDSTFKGIFGEDASAKLTLTYTLTGNELSIKTHVKNDGKVSLPFSTACHPWLLRDGPNVAYSSSDTAHWVAEDLIPKGLEDVAGRHDFTKEPMYLTIPYDDVYKGARPDKAGFAYSTLIRQDGITVTLGRQVASYPNSVLWAPDFKDKPVVGVEAQSGATNAVNMQEGDLAKESGLVELKPGNEWDGTVILKVGVKGAGSLQQLPVYPMGVPNTLKDFKLSPATWIGERGTGAESIVIRRGQARIATESIADLVRGLNGLVAAGELPNSWQFSVNDIPSIPESRFVLTDGYGRRFYINGDSPVQIAEMLNILVRVNDIRPFLEEVERLYRDGELGAARYGNNIIGEAWVYASVIESMLDDSNITDKAERERYRSALRLVLWGKLRGIGVLPNIIADILNRLTIVSAGKPGEQDMAAGQVTEITDSDFEKFLAGKTVVVDVGNEGWCHPCREYGPIFAQVAQAYSGRPIHFAKYTLPNEHSAFRVKYMRHPEISAIPATFIIVNGVVKAHSIGRMSAESLTRFIDDNVPSQKPGEQDMSVGGVASGSTGVSVTDLNIITRILQKDVIDMIARAGSGHPGGSLSMLQMIAALYFGRTADGKPVMNYDPNDPNWVNRDRFVLSKGHAAPGLYAALGRAGFFPTSEFNNLRKIHSMLQGHPDMTKTPGVDMSAGSLGVGLSAAVGMAFAAKLDARDYTTYCMLGDGEVQEGQIEEAASHAASLGLDNLVAFLDWNGMQIDGEVTKVDVGYEGQADKWKSRGWNVIKANGEDIQDVLRAIAEAKAAKKSGKPTIIIAKTTKGANLPGMKAHGSAPKPPDVEAATKIIEEDLARLGGEGFDREAFVRNLLPRTILAGGDKSDIDETNNAAYQIRQMNVHEVVQSDNASAIVDAAAKIYPADKKFSTRKADGDELTLLGAEDRNIVLMSADLKGSVMFDNFAKAFGEYSAANPTGRYVAIGIREAHMASFAAGLASCGKIPVISTFSIFTTRIVDQLNAVLNTKLPIIIVGTHAGLATEGDGRTHQDAHSQGVVGALPGVKLLEGADAEETRILTRQMYDRVKKDGGIYYIRPARLDTPILPKPEGWQNGAKKGFYAIFDSETGKPKTAGKYDVVIATTGVVAVDAIEAAKELAKQGKKVRVVNVCQLAEITDAKNIAEFARLINCKNLVTAIDALPEILGDRINRALIATRTVPSYVINLGINKWGESGKAAELYALHGFDKAGILDAAMNPTKFAPVLTRKDARDLRRAAKPGEQDMAAGAEPIDQPITIGSGDTAITAQNRRYAQPMERDNCPDGHLSELALESYADVAKLGYGIVEIEAAAVGKDRARFNQLMIDDEHQEDITQLVSHIRANSPQGEAQIVAIQPNHSGSISDGRFSQIIRTYPPRPDLKDPDNTPGKLLTDADVEPIIESYVKAAEVAYKAGANIVDIKCCHGYLLSQFLRPANEARKNWSWGGSLDNRVRIVEEIIRRIRQRVPDERFKILVRISLYEGDNIPGGIGTAAPNTVDINLGESVEMVKRFVAAGAQMMNVSAGIPKFNAERWVRPVKKPEGVRDISTLRLYHHVKFARLVRNALNEMGPKGKAVVVIGSGFSAFREDSRPMANLAIDNGDVDMAGVGRKTLAGEKPCGLCSGCSRLLAGQAPVGCTMHNELYKLLDRTRAHVKQAVLDGNLEARLTNIESQKTDLPILRGKTTIGKYTYSHLLKQVLLGYLDAATQLTDDVAKAAGNAQEADTVALADALDRISGVITLLQDMRDTNADLGGLYFIASHIGELVRQMQHDLRGHGEEAHKLAKAEEKLPRIQRTIYVFRTWAAYPQFNLPMVREVKTSVDITTDVEGRVLAAGAYSLGIPNATTLPYDEPRLLARHAAKPGEQDMAQSWWQRKHAPAVAAGSEQPVITVVGSIVADIIVPIGGKDNPYPVPTNSKLVCPGDKETKTRFTTPPSTATDGYLKGLLPGLRERLTVTYGGPAFASAMVLHELGAKVKLIGVVGKDALGDGLIALMRSKGMDVSGIRQVETHSTSTNLIFANQVSNVKSYNLAVGANECLLTSDVTDSDLEGAAVLHMGGIALNKNFMTSLPQLIERAKAKGVKIGLDTVIDVYGKEKSAVESMRKLDYMTPSMDEGPAISGKEKPKDNLAFFAGLCPAVFLKDGKNGSWVATNRKGVFGRSAKFYMPIIKGLNIVETTGAGDSFSAYIAYAVAMGLDVVEAAKGATVCGALTCERRGGGSIGDDPKMMFASKMDVFNRQLTSLVLRRDEVKIREAKPGVFEIRLPRFINPVILRKGQREADVLAGSNMQPLQTYSFWASPRYSPDTQHQLFLYSASSKIETAIDMNSLSVKSLNEALDILFGLAPQKPAAAKKATKPGEQDMSAETGAAEELVSRISVNDTENQMGAVAAKAILRDIETSVRERGKAVVLFASAPSQHSTWKYLISLWKGLPEDKQKFLQDRIVAFHMDEYVGLPENADQLFGRVLRERLFATLGIKPENTYYFNDRLGYKTALALRDAIDKGSEPEITRLTAQLEAEVRPHAEEVAAAFASHGGVFDVVIGGIGKLPHLAFNDPPEAKFNDPKMVKLVRLTETSRQQQVDDKEFAKLSDVPTHALTFSLPPILAGRHIHIMVPRAFKAEAVRQALDLEVDESIPASGLRLPNVLPNVRIYLDRESASKSGVAQAALVAQASKPLAVIKARKVVQKSIQLQLAEALCALRVPSSKDEEVDPEVLALFSDAADALAPVADAPIDDWFNAETLEAGTIIATKPHGQKGKAWYLIRLEDGRFIEVNSPTAYMRSSLNTRGDVARYFDKPYLLKPTDGDAERLKPLLARARELVSREEASKPAEQDMSKSPQPGNHVFKADHILHVIALSGIGNTGEFTIDDMMGAFEVVVNDHPEVELVMPTANQLKDGLYRSSSSLTNQGFVTIIDLRRETFVLSSAGRKRVGRLEPVLRKILERHKGNSGPSITVSRRADAAAARKLVTPAIDRWGKMPQELIEKMRGSGKRWYLGINSSTQSTTFTVIDFDTKEIIWQWQEKYEDALYADFKAPKGSLAHPDPNRHHTDPLMLAAALDQGMQELSEAFKCYGWDIHNIRAISGAGQQHGTVYYNGDARKILSSLDQAQPLEGQVGKALARRTAPIWRDKTTEAQKKAAEDFFGGAEILRQKTGSAGELRFGLLQAMKFAREEPGAYKATETIVNIAGFCGGLLSGVARFPFDYGDAAGSNAMDIHTNNWLPEIDRLVPGLRGKLADIKPTNQVVGPISRYWLKYGFSPATRIVNWTGDNPSAMTGQGIIGKGQVGISLGTSFTIYTYIDEAELAKTLESSIGNVFKEPTGKWMKLVCFQNGALALEEIRDKYITDEEAVARLGTAGITEAQFADPKAWKKRIDDAKWDIFNEEVGSIPAGNNRSMMITQNTQEEAVRIPYVKGRPFTHKLDLTTAGRATIMRAAVEGQVYFLKWVADAVGLDVKEINLTGGASKNPVVRRIMADIFNAKVNVLKKGYFPNEPVSLGGAINAAKADVDVESGQNIAWSEAVNGLVALDAEMATTPESANVATYRSFYPEFDKLVREAMTSAGKPDEQDMSSSDQIPTPDRPTHVMLPNGGQLDDAAIDQLESILAGMVDISDMNNVVIIDKRLYRSLLRDIAYEAANNSNEEVRIALQDIIFRTAPQMGVMPESIKRLYHAEGSFTIPSMNLRCATFDEARIAFETAKARDVGAMQFEIAPTEVAYTGQTLKEFSAMVMAAAAATGYEGPVFFKLDHLRMDTKKYAEDKEREIERVFGIIKEAVACGFYAIDIDTSVLEKNPKIVTSPVEQQRDNFEVSARLVEMTRSFMKDSGVDLALGVEVGEVGEAYITEEHIRAFLRNLQRILQERSRTLGWNIDMPDVLAIPSGTPHGGLRNPDTGEALTDVNIAFDLLEKAKGICREYGMVGPVQHGASKLPSKLFDMFPSRGVTEIHLATAMSDIEIDKILPASVRQAMLDEFAASDAARKIQDKRRAEHKEPFNDQALRKNTERRKLIGKYKAAFWNLDKGQRQLRETLLGQLFGEWFELLKTAKTGTLVRDLYNVKPGEQDMSGSGYKRTARSTNFRLTTERLKLIAANFRRDVKNRGTPESSLSNIVTEIGKPTGLEVGTYYYIDLGGTNLRVGLAELQGNHTIKKKEKKDELSLPVPKEIMAGGGKTLFEFIAMAIRQFAKERNLSGTLSPGFTFSFPMRKEGLSRGIINPNCNVKGYLFSGVYDQEVVTLLQEALGGLKLTNLQVRVPALPNDTEAVRDTGVYLNPRTIAGGVYGTGHNDAIRDELGRSVNLESGAFDKLDTENDSPETLRLDRELDRLSSNPGVHPMEKRLSGKYIGPLFSLKVEREFNAGRLFAKDRARKLPRIFTDHDYDNEKHEYAGFAGEHVSEVEKRWEAGGAKSVMEYLRALGIHNPTPEDAEKVRNIAYDIMLRSAQLGAASFAGIVMAQEKSDTPEGQYAYAIDGSLLRYPNYIAMMKAALADIFGREYADSNLEVFEAADGAGIGAAIETMIVLTQGTPGAVTEEGPSHFGLAPETKSMTASGTVMETVSGAAVPAEEHITGTTRQEQDGEPGQNAQAEQVKPGEQDMSLERDETGDFGGDGHGWIDLDAEKARLVQSAAAVAAPAVLAGRAEAALDIVAEVQPDTTGPVSAALPGAAAAGAVASGIPEEIALMNELAPIVGGQIWNRSSMLHFIIPDEFASVEDLAAADEGFNYGARFSFERVGGAVSGNIDEYIKLVLKRVKAGEERNTAVILPERGLTEEHLRQIVTAGLSFVIMPVDDINVRNNAELRGSGENRMKRLRFQRHTFSEMALLRFADAETLQDPRVLNAVRAHLRSHFNFKGDMTADAYIEALKNNDVAGLINGYLSYRKFERYDAIQEHRTISASQIFA